MTPAQLKNECSFYTKHNPYLIRALFKTERDEWEILVEERVENNFVNSFFISIEDLPGVNTKVLRSLVYLTMQTIELTRQNATQATPKDPEKK